MAFELKATPNALSHAELTAISLKWLKRQPSAGGPGCNLAIAEVKSGYTGEIPDAIGFKLGHPGLESTVIEVKVSRSDFLADRKKPHRISGGMGVYRYFMAPKGMIRIDELPERWGLIEVSARGHCKVLAGAMQQKLGGPDNKWRLMVNDPKDWVHEHDVVREQWLLVKLLSQIGDSEEVNRKRKELYRNLDAVRSERDEAQKRLDEAQKTIRQLRRDVRLLSPVAIPRAVSPCE